MRIEALETAIPETRMPVDAIIGDAGGNARDAEAFVGLFGMEEVAAAEKGAGAAGWLDRLAAQMAPAVCGMRQALIHVHSLPVTGSVALPEAAVLARRHRAFAGLVHLFDIDQHNCAGLFYALAVARRMLEAAMIDEVFIFCGDSLAAWHPRHRYVPGCTLLGDGFALLRLTAAADGLQVGKVATAHHAAFAAGLAADEAGMRAFNAAHLDLIGDALAGIGHQPGDGTLYPHNINGLCWRLFARRTGVQADMIRTELVRDVGHCCASDPLLVLKRQLDTGTSNPDGAMIAVGMGGYVGAAAISAAAAGHAI